MFVSSHEVLASGCFRWVLALVRALVARLLLACRRLQKRAAARRYKCMEIERVVAEWPALKCCDSTAVGVEQVPLKSSVYMGNGWFSSSLRAL